MSIQALEALDILGGRALPAKPITYDEFLKWLTNDTHAEWVDGWVVPMSPVTGEHDEIIGFLRALFELMLEIMPIGKVRGDPFQMKTGLGLPGRAPDLFFIANAHLDRLHATFLEGPADIAIEVISPGSVDRDREEKFREYERGGVPEYWLLDPLLRQADFSALGEDGRYHPIALEAGGIFRSRVLPHLWLKVEWLWEPRAKVLDILREWGII